VYSAILLGDLFYLFCFDRKDGLKRAQLAEGEYVYEIFAFFVHLFWTISYVYLSTQ